MSDFMINKILYAEISAIGVVFTSILMKKSIPEHGIKSVSKQARIFIHMLFCLVVIFILDGITWCIDGVSFKGMKPIYSVCLVIYFILNPTIGFLWNVYVNTKLHINLRKIRSYQILCVLPFAINVVLCVASPFTEWIFKIDENGAYSRGILYPFNTAMSFVYYIISVVLLINHMRKNKRLRTNKELVYLAFFPVAPLIGSILQGLIYGISVVYICILVSFLIIFINVQNEQIYTDAGTGLRNKSYLSVYLNDKLLSMKKNSLIGAILIDLDYFKNLNDTYGHTAGDEALRDVASVLNQVFDANVDCVSRFGGDEFVVLMVRGSEEEVKQEIGKLKKSMEEFNKSEKREYKLHFSVGYAIGRCGEYIDNITLDGLLKIADVNMYADKKLNHAAVAKS